MKTPPLLIGATLLFWGYQTGFLPEAIGMGLILESSRVIKARWEFSDDEFARVWTFSMMLFLAAVIFAFSDNGGFAGIGEFFQHPDFTTERDAGNASTMTFDAVFRWLPMIFFLFVLAQTFSPANGVPWEAISLYLRSRLKKARKRGLSLPPSRRFDTIYPYFAICLFSAGASPAQNDYYYYGICLLLAWALWPLRSRRFGLPMWIVLLAVAFVIGFLGQHAYAQLVRLAGQYDPQLLSLLYRMRPDPKEDSNEADLHTGKLKLSGKIVIRLETKNGARPPTYLRTASYRKFQESSFIGRKQLSWEAGVTNNDFNEVYETPRDSGIWPLTGFTGNRSVVTIACYLNGINQSDKYPEDLLPLPADCNRLESFRAFFVRQNNIGAVLGEGPRLAIFDARFGSGMALDARPETDTYATNEDLYVPTNEIPGLEQVISRLNLAGKSDDEKLQAIDEYFQNNFTYSLYQDPTTNGTALTRFLLQTRSGYCEYFATATVLLLRELGIPARYATGYYVHEPAGQGYVVRLRDAHAWCLVWDKKKQVWKNFDTTPASWVTQEDHSSPFQFLSDFISWITFEIVKFFEYGHSNIRDYFLWALIPALAFLLYRIFRSSRRHKKGDNQFEPPDWPGLDSEFYEVEQKLIQNGLPRQSGEAASVWLKRAIENNDLVEFKEPLENILALHYRYRFDPRGLTPSERLALRRNVEAFLAAASDR